MLIAAVFTITYAAPLNIKATSVDTAALKTDKTIIINTFFQYCQEAIILLACLNLKNDNQESVVTNMYVKAIA